MQRFIQHVTTAMQQKYCPQLVMTLLFTGSTSLCTANAPSIIAYNLNKTPQTQQRCTHFTGSNTLVDSNLSKQTQCLHKQLLPWLNNASATADVTTNTAAFYQASKAQAWLDYADHQSSEDSLTQAHQFALAEAQRIIAHLQNNTVADIGMVTPIPPMSGLMRPDLWITAERLKKHPNFSQVSKQVAQAEVKLVWAAAEYCELGWRHSREHFSAAERWLTAAKTTVITATNVPAWQLTDDQAAFNRIDNRDVGCHGEPAQWALTVAGFTTTPMQPEPTPVPTAPPVVYQPSIPQQVLRLPNTIHFALDKFDLTNNSKAVLKVIVNALNENANINVTLYGYADPRASVAYNQTLSARRTAAVENYLVSQGVDINRIAKEPRGETAIIKDAHNAILDHAKSRRVEVRFASSQGQEIKSYPQYQDLQLEHWLPICLSD